MSFNIKVSTAKRKGSTHLNELSETCHLDALEKLI